MILGALLHEPEKPAWFLPISGRLYFRQSQLPIGPDGIVEFRTKCELAVELLREQARIIRGSTWRFLTAATPSRAWSGRWSCPQPVHPRIDFLTRLRCDARLYALPLPPEAPRGSRDRSKWGKRLQPPCRGGSGREVAGRDRLRLWPTADNPLEGIICLWWVPGWEVPVKVIVASVEGYNKRFTWSPRRWS